MTKVVRKQFPPEFNEEAHDLNELVRPTPAAEQQVFEHIEVEYNRQRKHSAIEYFGSEQFE